MTTKKKTVVKKTTKYKVVDLDFYKLKYNNTWPYYHELSEGESVEIKSLDKMMQGLLDNKIIKEV